MVLRPVVVAGRRGGGSPWPSIHRGVVVSELGCSAALVHVAQVEQPRPAPAGDDSRHSLCAGRAVGAVSDGPNRRGAAGTRRWEDPARPGPGGVGWRASRACAATAAISSPPTAATIHLSGGPLTGGGAAEAGCGAAAAAGQARRRAGHRRATCSGPSGGRVRRRTANSRRRTRSHARRSRDRCAGRGFS